MYNITHNIGSINWPAKKTTKKRLQMRRLELLPKLPKHRTLLLVTYKPESKKSSCVKFKYRKKTVLWIVKMIFRSFMYVLHLLAFKSRNEIYTWKFSSDLKTNHKSLTEASHGWWRQLAVRGGQWRGRGAGGRHWGSRSCQRWDDTIFKQTRSRQEQAQKFWTLVYGLGTSFDHVLLGHGELTCVCSSSRCGLGTPSWQLGLLGASIWAMYSNSKTLKVRGVGWWWPISGEKEGKWLMAFGHLD